MLPMPMKLFGSVGLIEDFDRDRLTFFKAQQRSRKLSVIGGHRNEAFGSYLDNGVLDVKRVIRHSSIALGTESTPHERRRNDKRSGCQAGRFEKSPAGIRCIFHGMHLTACFGRAGHPEPNSRRPLKPEKSRNRTSQSPSAHRSCTRTPGSAGIIRGSLSSQWRCKSRSEVGRRRLSCKGRAAPVPQTVSNVPTKRAVKQGCGSPIFVKRTTPMFGSMYLKMPWVRKISPAARPISRKKWNSAFIWVAYSLSAKKMLPG